MYPGMRCRRKNRPPPPSHIPPPQLSSPLRWFDYFDTDRSGYLDREELVQALRRTAGFSHQPESSLRENVNSVWPAFDRDGNGVIDKREFCAPGGLGEALFALTGGSIGGGGGGVPVATPIVSSTPYVPHATPVAAVYSPAAVSGAPPPPYVPGSSSNAPSAPPMASAPPLYVPSVSNANPPSTVPGSFVSTPAPYVPPSSAPAPYVPVAHHPSVPVASHPSAPTQQPPQQQFQNMKVNVPAGRGPGQKVAIFAPSGEKVVITIPNRNAWNSLNPPTFICRVPVSTAPVVVQGTTLSSRPPPPPTPAMTPWRPWESFRSSGPANVPFHTTQVPASPPGTIFPPTGRRRALLIGINYNGSRAQLRGCVNDARNMKQLLVEAGFRDDSTHIVTLLDEGASSAQPTRANITKALQWLVHDVVPGDVLFFHFSGHGAQQPDRSGLESDGMNETILPVDYRRSGQITDDEIWSSLAYPLPEGVRLTAIMDCCHSGTGLDLPFEFKLDRHGDGRWIEDINPAHSRGDVILFSGCEDSQTSADAFDRRQGQAGGAMTQSFVLAYRQNPMARFPDFMSAIHTALRRRGFPQRPQLTTSQRFDVSERVFSFVEGIEANHNSTIGRTQRKVIRPGSAGYHGGGNDQLNALLFGGAVGLGMGMLADALFG